MKRMKDKKNVKPTLNVNMTLMLTVNVSKIKKNGLSNMKCPAQKIMLLSQKHVSPKRSCLLICKYAHFQKEHRQKIQRSVKLSKGLVLTFLGRNLLGLCKMGLMTQSAITCLKVTIVTLEQGVKYVQS